MNSVTAKLREEVRKLVPPTIYFFVSLHLIAIVRNLFLEGTDISLVPSLTVTVAALILAKAVLLADLLPFINRFPGKPMIYNIAWKTVIYTGFAGALHYLEQLIDFWGEAGGFVAGNRALVEQMVWPHFWAVQIFLLMLVSNYCVFGEFARVLGADTVKTMVLGPRAQEAGAAQ